VSLFCEQSFCQYVCTAVPATAQSYPEVYSCTQFWPWPIVQFIHFDFEVTTHKHFENWCCATVHRKTNKITVHWYSRLVENMWIRTLRWIKSFKGERWFKMIQSSVSDPDPDPPGSTAFGRIRIHFNPRSGSRSGSGSTSISFLGSGST